MLKLVRLEKKKKKMKIYGLFNKHYNSFFFGMFAWNRSISLREQFILLNKKEIILNEFFFTLLVHSNVSWVYLFGIKHPVNEVPYALHFNKNKFYLLPSEEITLKHISFSRAISKMSIWFSQSGKEQFLSLYFCLCMSGSKFKGK